MGGHCLKIDTGQERMIKDTYLRDTVYLNTYLTLSKSF